MKKTHFSLLMVLIMLFSFSFNAYAQEKEMNEFIDSDQETIPCFDPYYYVREISEAINEVGMTAAFGSVLKDPERYQLLTLSELNISEDLDISDTEKEITLSCSFPELEINDEIVALLGLGSEENIEWCELKKVSAENGAVTISITAEIVKMALQYENTILAFLLLR